MKQITIDMIQDYRINELKYDFMGYVFKDLRELSFHHLIVPRRDCPHKRLGDGYYKWNGAILVRDTAHDYLHLIEHYDEELFDLLTAEMIDQNVQNRLNIANLKRIRNILLAFEQEYGDEVDAHGKHLIKQRYITNRIQL